MSTYRVPKCGRHFVNFDDVTIYPVLVVARTGKAYVMIIEAYVMISKASTCTGCSHKLPATGQLYTEGVREIIDRGLT